MILVARRIVCILGAVHGLSQLPRDYRLGVTVVTYNRPEYLARCLQQVARQDFAKDRLEVIIIDDSSPECRPAVEASLNTSLEDFLYPARLVYEAVPRSSIGSKRNLALKRAVDHGCAVVINCDDDDIFAANRFSLQVEPIANGQCQATLATPETWLYEPQGIRMSWPFGPQLIASIDPYCQYGLELVDEAIATLALRLDAIPDQIQFPDTSYDEDRIFLRSLKLQHLNMIRLPPGHPGFTHCKHKGAASFGPLTKLYTSNLGLLASPFFALPLAFLLVLTTSKLLKDFTFIFLPFFASSF